ncbi:hypothetical protein N7539_003800, partial [Penicillium diatomitis]
MANHRQTEHLYAIFVHAGAGYHSHDNEEMHLEACKNAAEAGMNILRSGGTAVDAVEVAIMTFEDTPVTNSGYGSNLTASGEVEGDATIVDHFGRSGACGAVPTVKNPIMLARKIYDQAHSAPGISRIPPNLLVGQGAADFAWDNGLLLVDPEHLIAPGPRARHETWCKDVAAFESKNPDSGKRKKFLKWIRRPGIRTLDQTDIPESDTERVSPASCDSRVHGNGSTRIGRPESPEDSDGHGSGFHSESPEVVSGSSQECSESASADHKSDPTAYQQNAPPKDDQANSRVDLGNLMDPKTDNNDKITDTVGVIAVDNLGNIAAGSSSGGIGMKHRGRVGPAALVGIGTYVLPANPADPDKTTVATCTSGTGEHIASTLAASTAARRIYYSQCKDSEGHLVSVCEEEALADMIKHDYHEVLTWITSGHPALINTEIEGSIGIMSVKKDIEGISFIFAHSSDSFALASMSSSDEEPSCLMSRITRSGATALGGLYFEYP